MALKVKIIKEIPFNGVGNLDVSKTQVVVVGNTTIFDAQVDADKKEVTKLTAENKAIHAQIEADKINVQSNTDKTQTNTNTVNTLTAEVRTAHTHIEADKAAVTSMRNEVEADRANVQTNTNTVNTLTAEVRTTHTHIEADKATVAADKAVVNTDKNQVRSDRDIVRADQIKVNADKINIQSNTDKTQTNTNTVNTLTAEVRTTHAHIEADKTLVTSMKTSVEASQRDVAAKTVIATTKAAEASTSASNALTQANRSKSEADRAERAGSTITASILEGGSCDLSTGVYPAPMVDSNNVKKSTFWKVVKGGTVSGAEYGVGDTLVYSAKLSSYYKIDNTESVTSVNGLKGVVNLNAGHVGAYNKAETDSRVNTVTNTANSKVSKSGDTMTGQLTNTKSIRILSAGSHTGDPSLSEFSLYGSHGSATRYGMNLLDTSGSGSTWSTNIFTANQSNRRINFSKLNGAGTKSSDYSILAYVNGDDSNVYISGAQSASANALTRKDYVDSKDNLRRLITDSYSKAEVDSRVTSATNTANTKVSKAGDTMTGNLTFSNDSKIAWSRNTDGAEISFKNTSDSDTDSYMRFNVLDNGNEFFKWTSQNGSVNSEWLSLKSDGLRVKGNLVYHTGNKPSASTLGVYAVNQDITIDKVAPRLWLRGDINAADAGKVYVTEDTSHGGWFGYDGSSNVVRYGYRVNSVDSTAFEHNYNSPDVRFMGSISMGTTTVRKTSTGDLEFLV